MEEQDIIDELTAKAAAMEQNKLVQRAHDIKRAF